MKSHLRSLAIATAMAGAACSASDTETDGGTGGKPSSVDVTISGEALAYGGYAFPSSGDEPSLVDGWEIRFEKVLVTVDKIRLSENPDKMPTDPSQIDAVVKELSGPWAVDLHRQGPLAGKGGGDETAFSLEHIGDVTFDSTKRYAFGFDSVPASPAAKRLLPAEDDADYQEMIDKGLTTLFVGTATFRGVDCRSSDAAYDFSKFPTEVHFRFGFKNPTSYVNCQNPDNDPAAAFEGEEHQRGLLIKENTATVAQVTMHTDHLFWESMEHDAPLRFDMIAARYAGAGPVANATLEDLVGVSFTPVKDPAGTPVPSRSCVASDAYALPSTALTLDTKGVNVNPSGSAGDSIRDLSDYITYNASTMGHLNADGLCYVRRNYPSPP
jgi:hypothetical protein